jgi:hypothetical protein
MEEKIKKVLPLFEEAEQYGKTTVELWKLKAVDKTAVISSGIVSRGIAVLLIAMFVLIASIGIALWLGDLLGKTYYGFFCVAGAYGIAGAIVYLVLHKSIKQKVGDAIVKQMLN